MARHVSRAQRRAIRRECVDEFAPLLFDSLQEFAFVLSSTWSPDNPDDRRAVQGAVFEFLTRYLKERDHTTSVFEEDDHEDDRRPVPRRSRRTDPEGLEWRLSVFRGRAFLLRNQDLPTQPLVKAIRTEAGNLLTDLPADHEARDEVFAILCAADDIVTAGPQVGPH